MLRFGIPMRPRGKLIGEFILIVVGVLVALMVETALENRADERLADEYLSRIKTDLESDKTALEHRIVFFSGVQGFSQDVSRWLDTGDEVDQGLLLASFYAAEVWPLAPNTGTYQDLLSTGNIRLLDDIDLRTSMALYYNRAASTQAGMTPNEDYREVIRGVIPTAVQELIRMNCPTTSEIDQTPSGFPPCALPAVDYEQLAHLYAPLRADANFRRVVTYRHSELGVMVFLLRQQVTNANKVLREIEQQ